LDEQGGFLGEKDFCLDDGLTGVGQRQGAYSGNITLHQLFISIWKRARKEINLATKISFVGLSMHDFLNSAFRFLFAERKEDAEIVCANKDHQKFLGAGRERTREILLNPLSPTWKLRRLLKEICPAIEGINPGYIGESAWTQSGPGVRFRETFEDFIQNEMD